MDISKETLNIAVACPSYRRPRCITSEYIGDVHIYVDPDEAEEYRDANERGVVVPCAAGVQGNLPRVRNYILDTEFGNGADVVVMLDDDVSSLATFRPNSETKFGYERRLLTEADFYEFVRYGSVLCEEWGFGMWGVNYNQDKMLYKHFQPFSTQRSAVGQFLVFVKNDLRFDESLPLKEDYDMCLQQLDRHRGVLVINFVHVNGDFGKLTGGTSVRRNFDAEFEQFKMFKSKWGSDIVRGASKQQGWGHTLDSSKTFIGKYDFSHPIVKSPIKGV